MKKLQFIFAVIIFLSTACETSTDPETIYPESYLPAYPQSYWDYTNGERVLTGTTYELHSYESDISSTEKTGEKYVPVYDGQYLYEYSITQNSTVYPIKTLLETTVGESWQVNEINGEPIMRYVVEELDTLIIPFPPYSNPVDCIFTDVLVVVEYTDSLDVTDSIYEDRWSLKEYYADSVGLVRVDVNNPFDTLDAVIQKQIQGYSINW